MKSERLQWSLSILLYFIVIGMLLLSAKPQCTESSIVEKIDRVSISGTESIYRCSAQQTVPYSTYFELQVSAIERRVESVAAYLGKLQPLKSRIIIVIDETKPILFKISANRLFIGSQLFESEGHFERAIIKMWLLERTKNKVGQNLFLEVAADFLFYAYKGSFIIEDPLSKIKTKVSNLRWPQVLKSKDGYCDSPWKISEHYVPCDSIQPDTMLSEQLANNLSIRPLMTSVWIKAYSELAFRDRISFLDSFVEYLKTQQLSSEKAIQMILSDSHPLKQGMMNIKKMTDMMSSSAFVQDRKEYREFYSRMALNLQQAGVNDSFAEAYFDYLFEYPDTLSTDSIFFKNLLQISQKNPELQISVKDQSQIWILPTVSSLPLTTFDLIKTQQHVFFACPSLKEIKMQQFFNHAEKLLLVKGCDQNKAMNFESLILNGIQSFSAKNKKLAFIQFHMPSLEMKAKDLAHVKNYFDLVKNRDVSQNEFQTLGWSQIQWIEDMQAYKPNAVIDAIELFRTETN